MIRKLFYSLPWVFLSACIGSGNDKYRDTKNLELPPTLTIEHTNNTVNRSNNADDLKTPIKQESVSKSSEQAKPREISPTSETPNTNKNSDKSPNSELNKLILLTGNEKKPILQLKTRFDRAWILVADGLISADIEIVDRDIEAGVFKVRYVDKGEGNGRGLLSSVTSFFTDKFEDTEYKLILDKDKKITDVHVEKLVNGENTDKETFNKDDSAALMRLLHKSIIDYLSK